MRYLTFLAICWAWFGLGPAQPARAAGEQLSFLWPGQAPGEKGDIGAEGDTTKPGDNQVAGLPVVRIGNVSKPSITVYPASKDKANGAAVIICPGGGYHILAWDLEGTEVAEWLNQIGVTAVILKYRVPARKDRTRFDAPLQDLQRAMGLVRSRAAEWGIDPARIGVMGFSAGAHLSAALSCNFEKRTYPVVDAADNASCRPDFVMLIYPGYLVEKGTTNLPPELRLSAKVAPTFIAQTQDDSVPVEGSLFYYAGLKQAKVPAEMHLFAKGGHGYGLRPTDQPVTGWPKLAEAWMRNLGMLKSKK
jgi:acetyl esterase/lipase